MIKRNFLVCIIIMAAITTPSCTEKYTEAISKSVKDVYTQASSGQTNSKLSSSEGSQEKDKAISKIDDCLCLRPVEKYKLSDNVFGLFNMGLKSSFKKMLGQEMSFDDMKSGAKKMNWMPLWLEIKYGQAIHNENVKKGLVVSRKSTSRKHRKSYSQADDLLGTVLKNFNEKHPYDFKLYVAKMPGVNAEALPGGIIYISQTALKKRNRDMGTFVLSHEISHILKRHTTKQFQATVIDTATTVEDLKDLLSSPKQKNPDFSAVIEKLVATGKLFMTYNVNQEHQADVCAIQLMKKNKTINLVNGVEMFLKCEESKKTDKETARLGTHPTYHNRSQVIHKAIETIYSQKTSTGINKKQ